MKRKGFLIIISVIFLLVIFTFTFEVVETETHEVKSSIGFTGTYHPVTDPRPYPPCGEINYSDKTEVNSTFEKNTTFPLLTEVENIFLLEWTCVLALLLVLGKYKKKINFYFLINQRRENK